jgi:hypothetical protein
MRHLVRWNNELSSFGLTIVAPAGGDDNAVKAKSQSLGINFAVLDSVSGAPSGGGIPHALLFDHTGKCIFRGSPFEMEGKLRMAVGTALADLGEPSKSKTLAPILDALKKGQAPLSVIPRVVPMARSFDKTTAGEAQKLLDRLTAAGQKRLEQAEQMKESDPIEAYYTVEDVPTDFKGTPVGTKAQTLVTALRKDKAVAQELKARPTLDSIRRIDAFLTKVGGDANPTDPAFQKTHASSLASIKNQVKTMQKSYPIAKATQEAAEIAEKYGLKP